MIAQLTMLYGIMLETLREHIHKMSFAKMRMLRLTWDKTCENNIKNEKIMEYLETKPKKDTIRER